LSALAPEPRVVAEEYRRWLQAYLRESGESALLEAYRLGRQAAVSGCALQSYAAIHHEALAGVLGGEDGASGTAVLVRRAGEFFAEFAAPFAMPVPFDEAIAARREADAQRLRLAALEQVDRLKDQFLSVLSHELRTPLNAIIGFGSILADEVAGELKPAQREYLARMDAAASWLLDLINDLLDLSRVQAGKFQVLPREIDIRTVLAEASRATEASAVAKRLAIATEIAPGVGMIRADPQRVLQVLLNLLSNAVKFTPEGGTVTLRAAPADGDVVCAVSDTGPGISAEQVPLLFQPFYQVDMSDARATGGTGLGLSISKALVEAHGGEIGVLSEPGRGSTFWFRLPVQGPPASPTPGTR